MTTAQMTADIMDKFDLRDVQKYRKARGLTRVALAEQASVRRQTLRVWETEPIQKIDAKLVSSVARVLGVSPWDFIRIIDIPDPDESPSE